jgi:hypothetical protein
MTWLYHIEWLRSKVALTPDRLDSDDIAALPQQLERDALMR